MGNTIESLQVSLEGLLKHTQIERIVIPIIQRDYAQGRVNEQDIRDNFLISLKSYLEDSSKNSHDLDFVYGNKNQDDEFIPLDGQQRLTTLFLLHYYLSIHDNCYDAFRSTFVKKDNSPRFVYQTRATSSDFCKALVNNPLNTDSLATISSTIKNKCPWFSISWLNDPTVTAMLNMLDSIALYFKDTEGLYNRLTDANSPAITFRILFMEESGLKDDLYIKMNSRGLELSPFENLKAKIIQILKSNKEKNCPLQRSQNLPVEMVSSKDYFSFKMDIDWSDLFWMYKKEHKRRTDTGEDYSVWDIDTPMLNFISTIALNYKALSDNVTNEDLTNYDKLKWAFYSDLDINFYLYLIKVFDLFYKNSCLDETPSAGICDRLNGNSKFNIRKTFQDFVNKKYVDAAYDDHIRLYAYYEYLICHGENYDQEDFRQWMRIVMNLTNNTTWQDVKDFCRAMNTIQWLNENNKQGILHLMSQGKDELKTVGFSPLQFHEECIKACLLSRPNAYIWMEKIETAENNGYFKGQILCLLNFCGIEDYFIKNKNCLWNNEEDAIFSANFDNYAERLWLIFDDKGLKESLTHNQVFRRALLSYGSYCLQLGNNRWSFLIDQSRDYSWRRYLQAEVDENSKRQRGYFKELMDNYIIGTDLKEYLQDCISKSSVNVKDWRSLMVVEPNIWEHFGSVLFACFDNDNNDVYILSTKTMGGWHCELRTIYLYYKLQHTSNVEYQWSQNWETFPSLNYTNENGVEFNIRYQNNKWCITYNPQSITPEIEITGFTLCENNIYLLEREELDNSFLSFLKNFQVK